MELEKWTVQAWLASQGERTQFSLLVVRIPAMGPQLNAKGKKIQKRWLFRKNTKQIN